MDSRPLARLDQISQYISFSQSSLVSLFGFTAIAFERGLRHSIDVLFMKSCDSSKEAVKDTAEFFEKLSPNRDAVVSHIPEPEQSVDASQFSMKTHSLTMITFYLGYLITHIPAGVMADTYGGKWVLATSMCALAFASFITVPIISYCGLRGMLLVRFLMGLCEGPLFPSQCALMSQWVPKEKRATLCSIVLGAGHIGVLIVNFIIGYLTSQYQWTHILQFFGVCTLLWLLLFISLCYNESPSSKPSTSLSPNIDNIGCKEATVSILSPSYKPPAKKKRVSWNLPWYYMFTNAHVWAFIATNIQHSSSENNYIREVINYLSNLKCTPYLANLPLFLQISMPFVVNWFISMGSGLLSDILINRHILTTTECRRLMTFIAAFGPKCCTMLVNACFCCNHNQGSALSNVFRSLISAIGVYYAGIQLTAIDLSPNHAGTLMAIANSFGALSNIFIPYIERHINKSNSVNSCIRTVTWLFCILFTSGETQTFDEITL